MEQVRCPKNAGNRSQTGLGWLLPLAAFLRHDSGGGIYFDDPMANRAFRVRMYMTPWLTAGVA